MEIFYPEAREITVGGKKLFIKPFVLKNRTKVLRILSELYRKFLEANPVAQNGAVNITSATDILEIAGDKLIEIYEIVLEQPRQWLDENITMNDEMAIIQAVIEINNFPLLVRQALKLLPKK